MNLGSSDGDSFARYADVYNRSIIDLMSDFEDTYVSLIKAIRTLAYPSVSPLSNAGSYLSTSRKRSNSRRGRAAYQGELAVAFEVQYPASDYLGYDGSDGDGINGIDEDDEPFGGPLIPIFVMRPFGSEMERSALEVVRRLRKDGDKNVFWIDTSGWLEIPNPPHGTVPSKADETEDYYFAAGNSSAPSDISTYLLSQFKLTPRANQKVAIYLHMHVCRYLAAKGDKCPFLKSQTYEGKVYEPAMERLERWTQGEVEGKVKAVLMEKERPKAEKGEEKGLDGL